MIGQTKEQVFQLVDAIVKLGRIELRGDTKLLGRLAIVALLCLGLAIAGYSLLVVGLLHGVGRWVSPWAALLAAGGVHIALAVVVVSRLSQRVKELRPMHRTIDEIARAGRALRGAERELEPAARALAAADNAQPSRGS